MDSNIPRQGKWWKWLKGICIFTSYLKNMICQCKMEDGSMSTRHELTDEQWAVIEPLLPKPKPGPGRPPADPRKTLNGILYVLKTGCTWADMPRQYGSPT